MLLVEDERTLADIIADTLGEKEFDVTVAYDGIEGLRRFDEARPDVVVTDIMMPGMDGFSFVDALRRRTADIPVLFLSARSSAEDVVRGFETGGNDYLRKPFAMSELVVRVKALVGRTRTAHAPSEVHYRIGRFDFDVSRQRLSDGVRTQELSAREAGVLEMLCERMGEVVPSQRILQRIWATTRSSTPAACTSSSRACAGCSRPIRPSGSSMPAASGTASTADGAAARHPRAHHFRQSTATLITPSRRSSKRR